jgi:hypothetical protein
LGHLASTLARVTKSRGRVQQRERSLPVLDPPVHEEPWKRPAAGQGELYPIDLRLPGRGRVKGWTQFDESNRMLDFCLLAQVFHDGEWWDVIKFDTWHDSVHVHYYYRTRTYVDKEVIIPIQCMNDVDRGYRMADTLVITCWRENLARWRDGI